MSNFSNSEHHQVTPSSNNPHFFNNDALSGIDGFANGEPGDSIDQSWGFVPNQYDSSGSSAAAWPAGVSQQMHQPSTFRPGARPDQTISSSSFGSAFPGSVANGGYTANLSNFAGYSQQQYNSSTVAPSHLSSHPANNQHHQSTQLPNGYLAGSGNTVSPEALQSRPYLQGAAASLGQSWSSQNVQSSAEPARARPVPNELPKGEIVGNFTVLNADRIRPNMDCRGVASYLDVGQQPFEYPISKSSIPIYFPRKSRSEIKHLLASDSRLKAKLNKKLSKKSGLTGTRSIPSQLDSTGKLTTQRAKKDEESSSEETSTDDSEYDSSDDEPSGPPLPATRPTKPREATRYDTIKCLWRPQSKPASAQDIRDGLKDFHDILSTIKERWKSDSSAVRDAEASKKVNEVPLLKERVKSQLDMLEAALKAASELGHPDILDHFGASLPSVGSMAVFLQDRAKEQDYSSSLVVAMLQFLAKCKLMDSGILEKSNVGKLLQRFTKRGSDTVKQLAKRVENNAAVTTKKKKDAPKSLTRTSSGDKDVKAEGGPKSPQSAAGVKRPRPADAAVGDQPAKKVAGKPGEPSTTKKPHAPGASLANKASTPAVAKSSSFISSLQSAKRPATKPTATSSAASGQSKPPPTKSPSESKPASSSPAGFSFASVLADVERAKVDKPTEAKTDEYRSSETADQRAKRLRRESRKRLRVSFKPEESLVEVRFFEHDPEEELGHDASQMRDVNDVGSEGKMFKLHQQHHEMMDIDDEDDLEQAPVEQTWREWKPLKLIDFQDVADKVTENYRPYGGGSLDPQCPEKAAQEEREASTLLAIYSDSSEIPPSPNEPPLGSDGISLETKDFGTADAINDRIEEVKKVPPRAPDQQGALTPDISAILSRLNQGGATVPPLAHQNVNQSNPNLASLLSQIPNMGTSQQPPAPAPMLPSQQPPQPPPAPDMSAILSSLNANQSQQPQTQLPNTNPSQPPPVDISSLLATLNASQRQAPAPAPAPPPPQMGMSPFPNMPGMPSMSNFNAQDPMWQAAHQYAASNVPNMWPQQQQEQTDGVYENEARKRWRESNDEEDDDPNGFKRQKAVKKTPNPKSFFTQVCKYYKEGRCNKGASCTYRHED